MGQGPLEGRETNFGLNSVRALDQWDGPKTKMKGHFPGWPLIHQKKRKKKKKN